MIDIFEQKIDELDRKGAVSSELLKVFKDSFLWIDQNLKEKSPYMKFIDVFNEVTKQSRGGDLNSRELFRKSGAKYSLSQRRQIITNLLKNDYYLNKGRHIITLSFVLDDDICNANLNYSPPKNNEANDTRDYSKDAEI